MTGAAARLPLILTELRLPTVKRLWAGLAEQSNKEGWPAERFLAAVMEHELAERETRRLERHRLESQLLPGKLLSSFDFTSVPTVSKAHVTALIEGDGWIEQGANLLLFGPPGVGKSHLVCAIGNGLIDRGYRVHFTRTSDLVQRLQVARREMRLPSEIARLDRFDLLILDDLSYVRRDQAETSVLFELIAARYERKSLAITANQPFSGWDQVFPEVAMTLAAVDRLVHHSTIFELNVESYRRRAATPGQARTSPKPTAKND
jgi:DNA replication protein DnaC